MSFAAKISPKNRIWHICLEPGCTEECIAPKCRKHVARPKQGGIPRSRAFNVFPCRFPGCTSNARGDFCHHHKPSAAIARRQWIARRKAEMQEERYCGIGSCDKCRDCTCSKIQKDPTITELIMLMKPREPVSNNTQNDECESGWATDESSFGASGWVSDDSSIADSDVESRGPDDIQLPSCAHVVPPMC